MEKLILALDCSLRWTNAAVFMGGATLISERFDIGRRQAAELPVIVKNALSETGHSFEHIGLLAVTNGPGYFTGIRIGVAYAAALAYALDVKVAPVSTLHMLAHPQIRQALKTPVLAAVYAGQERVYAASFGSDNELPAGGYKKNDIEKWLGTHENAEIVSDDPEKAFLPHLGRKITLVRPDAAEVAHIAWQSPETAVHPMNIRVSYHRDPL